MLRKNTLWLAILAVTFSLATSSARSQDKDTAANGDKQSKPSPFLITQGLPHLTKILMRHWEDPELSLAEEQKARLLVVRKETMAGVKSIAPQVASVQKQVAEGIFSGKTPEELDSAVQALSELKAKATRIQLKCIYDTSAILNQKQLDRLLAF